MTKINKNLHKEIINYYLNGKGCTEISKIYFVSSFTIRRILLKNNIILRSNSESKIKYKLNQNFFDEINTEEKAYFLGFLCADGHNNRKNNTISLRLKYSDHLIIKQLNDLVTENKPYKYITKNGYEYSGLRITNKHMSEILEKHGMIQNKTNCLKFIYLNNFNKDYIRGYFDGDGSIFYKINKNGSKSFHINIISTIYFIEKLKQIIENDIKINATIENKFYDKNKNVKKIHISGNRQVLRFLNYIYNNATIKLNRKYEKYIQLQDYLQNLDNYKCQTINCSNKHFSRGMCYAHYFAKKTLLNPKYSRSKKIDIEILIKMINNNEKIKNMAKHFNVSQSAISKFIKRRNL